MPQMMINDPLSSLSSDALARLVGPAVGLIKPILANKPAELQGAIIADLLAIWLAGHQVAGDSDATRALRSELLAFHLSCVRELTEVNAKIMGTQPSVDD